jgi:hypothetical protein
VLDVGTIPLLNQQESERIERACEGDSHPLRISLRNPWVKGDPPLILCFVRLLDRLVVARFIVANSSRRHQINDGGGDGGGDDS